jgi:hypothetical protein
LIFNEKIMRLLIIAASLILLAGCTVVNPTPDTLTERPADFTVVYEWQEGSLPPPYHYEYTIKIEPDGQGEIIMLPDYDTDATPYWVEPFAVTPTALDQFYRLLIDKGLFTQSWRAQSDPPVGGSYDSLQVTAHGQQIKIPSFLIAAQAAAAEDMAVAVRALVPPDIWNKLNAQREQYVKEHGQ